MREIASRARPCRRGLLKDEGERPAASPKFVERRFAAGALNRKGTSSVGQCGDGQLPLVDEDRARGPAYLTHAG